MHSNTNNLDLENQEANENDILNFIETPIEDNSNEDFLTEQIQETIDAQKNISSDNDLNTINNINVIPVEDKVLENEQINWNKVEKDLNKEDRKSKYSLKNILSSFTFIFKYLLTSVFIFALLLLTANYSAYTSIVKNYLFEDEIIETQKSLISSVKASVIKEKVKEKKEERKIFRNEKDIEIVNNEYKTSIYSMNQLMNRANREDIKIDISISPYENRIIIPKIWKNIPLIDIKRKIVSWKNELNDIFMKELEGWVIRYPWSVRPWDIWNTFIFWHSSNFPWVAWKYNEVFALLDKVTFDDEIIVYYWQDKFTYKVKEKKVIRPWNVWVLKSDKWKKELTLMTCWPVWTTLNRLIVVWELIED